MPRDASIGASEVTRAWLLDLGDTLLYFASHATPTGIQRTVIELEQALRRQLGSRLQLVAASPDGSGLHSIGAKDWQRLVGLISSGSPSVCREARLVLKTVQQTGFRAPVGDEGLLLLGAPWATPRYLDSVLSSWGGLGPVVPLVYDLTPVYRSENHDESMTHRFRRTLVAFSFASALMVISDFTGRDLEKWLTDEALPVPPIRTIRLASSRNASSTDPEEPLIGLAKPFVAIVSTIEGRKGHLAVLAAWERLLCEVPHSQVPHLLLVGRNGWNNEAVMSYLERSGFLSGKVTLTGPVTDGELTWIYRNSLFTIYPSEYEGWGLPVSESLAFGTPVLASNATSIPEAGGGSARYFQSGDDADLLAALREWILEPTLLDDWRAKARLYRPDTWSDVASRVESVMAESEQAVISSGWRRLDALNSRLPPPHSDGLLSRVAEAAAFSPLVAALLPFGTRRRRLMSAALRGIARGVRSVAPNSSGR